MRFRVPQELAPGVFRGGVVFFEPGHEFELPDAASPKNDKGEPDVALEAVSLKLIPLDKASRELLVKRQAALPDVAGPSVVAPDGRILPSMRPHEYKSLRIKPVEASAPEKPAPEKPMTIKEAAGAHGRAADK
jgi:hypothetical protein